MSFILDALKKSENERQQQQAADFATVPSGRDARRAPRWLWLLGVLLVANLAVVAGLLLRPDSTSPSQPAETAPAAQSPGPPDVRDAAPPESGGSASFSERVADARRRLPAEGPEQTDEVATTAAPAGESMPAGSPAEAPAAVPEPAKSGVAELPSLEELQLEDGVNLPPLHLDLHVYNESPLRRFVSINMNKYRENETLREGPLVREITREGVVLEYQGKAFALLQ